MKASQKRLVVKSLIEGLRRNGDRIFAISQETSRGFVAVDRGILRQSGYTRKLRNGIELGYKAPYSARVEFGQPEFHYTGSQNVKIKKHVIHTKEGVKTIKAHTRTYVNKRLVRIRPHQDWSRGEIEASYGMRIPGNVTNVKIYGAPIFVVMSRIPARRGQFFFSRAIFEGIKKLPDDMKWSLAKIGKVG